ncbi:HAD family hydrolase [Jannaschia aquimarina]|uniref:YvdM protein n=1 Tax=Jannaschia aquimarina TaxID=935700 RepID=A0A0D1CNW0_9RHOB|nr:HAD-IA family hydrolase [Jannaschia aquimarina]KIT16432.1 Beta-phosphoglucomutase [Jannaschia aquimarina]SNS92187.1 haloacid dehalogenase superfamily, subfamily IA, variant 3 with third motif having DD or ED [Jannaschia aquimarina]
MKALLLGSIGTLSDTSELQRRAFNEAFRKHDLPWEWDRDTYRGMLTQAGGKDRIQRQADADGVEVDAEAVHQTKSDLFQSYLDDGKATSRPGIVDLITKARAAEIPVGLVTTTSPGNVAAILRAVGLTSGDFDLVLSRSDVSAPKPAPDCYHLASAMLAVAPEDCVAVEDNPDGAKAALAAGCTCLAWPNENTAGQDFGSAEMVDDPLERVLPDTVAAE